MRAEYLFQPRGGTEGAGPRIRSIGLRNALGKDIITHLTRRGVDCTCFVSIPERPQDTMDNQGQPYTNCHAPTVSYSTSHLEQLETSFKAPSVLNGTQWSRSKHPQSL